MIFRWIKLGLLGLALTLFFMVLTFPFSRLGSVVESGLESGLGAALNTKIDCRLEDFRVNFPVSLNWSLLNCSIPRSNTQLFSFENSKFSLSLGSHRFETKIGNGRMDLKLHGLTSFDRVEGSLAQVELKEFLPIILYFANRANPNVPLDLKVEGSLTGKYTLPLKDLHQESGELNIKVANMALPGQPLLDLIGLSELKFSKASLSADLKEGKLLTKDIEAVSAMVSGKVEGDMALDEDLMKSKGDLRLKWKVEESDALLSSPFGQVILNAPCPSPDSNRFCTKRVTRLDQLGGSL